MIQGFTESVVKSAVLEWADAMGFGVVNGPEIAPGEPAAERESYGEIILAGRLRDALERLNPKIPSDALAMAAGVGSSGVKERESFLQPIQECHDEHPSAAVCTAAHQGNRNGGSFVLNRWPDTTIEDD